MRAKQVCDLTITESRVKINVLPIVCGSSVFVFVLICITLCLF